jgi:phage-related protein
MSALEKAENGNTTALYKLAPQLKETEGGIDDLAKSVKGAAEVSASPFAKFKVSLDEAKEVIGAAFLPVLEKLIETLSPLIEKIAPVLAKLIGALAPIFVQLVEALLPLIEQLLPPLVELLEALMPVILPLVKILTDLLVPIIKIVVQVFKFLLGAIKPIVSATGTLVKGMKDQFAGFGNFFKGIINGWLSLVQSFINFFIGGINGLIKTANVGLGFLGDLVGKKLTIGLLGKVTIPKLASGGIVSPSPGGSIVNVAEAGEAEAIIPLSKLGNLGGGNTYVININRAAISGEEVVRAIRRYETGLGRTSLV